MTKPSVADFLAIRPSGDACHVVIAGRETIARSAAIGGLECQRWEREEMIEIIRYAQAHGFLVAFMSCGVGPYAPRYQATMYAPIFCGDELLRYDYLGVR